ncbi:hypothetical protein MMG00_12815 [Ignatzschineria rhizosphaerae]|uniref:Phage tail protein n=1 Tax=Ignatzschineria rhizosphaerae TaxID=2923279 RepID=A0ABY3X7T3_9GAMM|nr:contractile injection system protein, VgrG/Pvc8 family [Ignatzschineria rhizosphaerae]UNM96063.1 hypothetical protein MMG00_12815 [Ignatzschineria rhizosphaerae]
MLVINQNQPNVAITINGMPSILLNNNINSISLIENRGFDADTLQIVINDSDGLIELPNRDAEIQIAIGFGINLINKGKFIVDSVMHSGPPDIITIGAHSADFKKELLERKSLLFENKTIQEIVEAIAKKHKLESKVAEIYQKIKIKEKSQANESDANLLTRIAEEYDAIATIKNGTLLFLERGAGKTASGESLDTITHHRSDGDQHNYTVSDRDQYTGVEVRFLLSDKAKRQTLIVGEDRRPFKIRKIYNNEKEAKTAADQQFKRLKRSLASVSVNLARGNAELSAESPLKLVGFKTEMDNHNWIVTTITHRIDASNGFVSELQGEVKA